MTKIDPVEEQKRRADRKIARQEQNQYLAALMRAREFMFNAAYAEYMNKQIDAIQNAIESLRAASYLAKTSRRTYMWKFKKEKKNGQSSKT